MAASLTAGSHYPVATGDELQIYHHILPAFVATIGSPSQEESAEAHDWLSERLDESVTIRTRPRPQRLQVNNRLTDDAVMPSKTGLRLSCS